MKVRRMLAIDKRIFDRLEYLCKKENLYRNNFVSIVLEKELERMNQYNTFEGRIRLKERKARFQIFIEADIYDSINKSKTQRIEKVLGYVMDEYEKGNRLYH